MKNFLLDFKKQERYIRADISRFGKVETFNRIWDDFGGLSEEGRPSLSYNNVEIIYLGNNIMKVITWPKIVSDENTPPDKIEYKNIERWSLIKELHLYLTTAY